MKFLILFLQLMLLAYPAAALEREPPPVPPKNALAKLDGRVFFTAAERRAMETKPPQIVVPPALPSPPPSVRRFDGALWRDGHIVALWFDKATVDPAREPAIRLKNGLPEMRVSGHAQPLLPGQPVQNAKP
ncbi:MAG: hypothetical protein LBG78_00575 [Azoarcus sp.]|jgi:hypothetical protein|nr:hypothetical protein [Azoarcus sp.]